jgi:hypothetical protein
MDELNAVSELLYGPGEPMTGREMSDEEAIAYAQSSFPFGNFCLVREWIWIDLEVNETQRTVLARTQRLPVMLYAHSVVFDSERRWDAGDFVRTSPLHAFEEGFHFKTLNSTYLLLGAGTRKHARTETVDRIF